ncbi:hypothetical protein J6590_036335 [Homalodisca vitripennis]|nr:hypothetical protein J6590_036335 [Homalodisca vitripennis]
MGKKKQAQRTKNNVVLQFTFLSVTLLESDAVTDLTPGIWSNVRLKRSNKKLVTEKPASSGRSAELLQSTSSVPLVGFSTLKEGGFIPILSGISDELDFCYSLPAVVAVQNFYNQHQVYRLLASAHLKKGVSSLSYLPASSGRSAELLQSTSSVPLVGFSTLKEGGFIPILSGISDELDFNIKEDFRLVWKKMNKKDKTTKLKALEEFKKLCQDTDVEALKPVLPYWPRLFCVLSTDEEQRVREAAHAAHKALVIKAGRNIAPYLKQLVGPWFTGQHDTYPPAASAAESAFQQYCVIENIEIV